MSELPTENQLVAVAVAPASTGVQQVGNRLDEALQGAGAQSRGPARMLARERFAVVEQVFEAPDAADVRAGLERVFSGLGDICVLPAKSRRKRLLVCDMDSTIIGQECLDELADFAGLKEEIAAITARAMAGELEFESALRERVSMLKGLSESTLEACYRERIALAPGAETLVQTMARSGSSCLLVSGGFTYFTERVSRAAGFADHRGNTLIIEDGVLTGEVGEPILGREAKLDALNALAEKAGAAPHDALAMGDGANDLAMIEAAGLGIACHAKPLVVAAADAAIQETDLSAALFFQGFSESQIVWCD